MTLSPEKYNPKVEVLCPTCGGKGLEHDPESPMAKCASCGLEITKAALVDANRENALAHANEMGKEIVKDMAKELKKAFGGNKTINIKL